MPRKLVPVIAAEPYHISARCINRQWFDLPLDTVWSIMEDYLYLMNFGFNVRIHAFVLMSNHFHLLLTPNSANLSEALLYFMRETSKQITRLSGRVNQTYGNRNHKTWIGNYHYFLNSYKYVYQNPVRAQICGAIEDYRFSTLHGLLGQSKLIIPIDESVILTPTLNFSELSWLNRKADPSLNDEMRIALKKPIFRLCMPQKSKKMSRLENELL